MRPPAVRPHLRLLPMHREEGRVKAFKLNELAEARRRVVQPRWPAAAVQRDHVVAVAQVGPKVRRALRVREPAS